MIEVNLEDFAKFLIKGKYVEDTEEYFVALKNKENEILDHTDFYLHTVQVHLTA